MKIQKPQTQKKNNDRRMIQYGAFEGAACAATLGQRVVRLSYSIYTYPGLEALFGIEEIRASQKQEAEVNAVKKFCEKNNVSEQLFKEMYRTQLCPNEDHVGVFKIMTDEEIKESTESFHEALQEKINDAISVGKSVVSMTNQELPDHNRPLFEVDVSRAALILEPVEFFCRSIIPQYALDAYDFALNHVGFHALVIGYVASDKLSIQSKTPFVLLGRVGPHYFAELASWA